MKIMRRSSGIIAVLLACAWCAAADLPAFKNSPSRVEGGGWSLEVVCPPGQVFELQRSFNLRDWETIETVTAAQATLTLVDPLATGPLQRFWRLKWQGGDSLAPVISNLRVVAMDDGLGQRVMLVQSEVTDAQGVTSVIYSTAPVPDLAQLTDLPGTVSQSGQTFTLPAGPLGEETVSRFFRARASDAAGNTGHSNLTGFLLADPDHLEAIDPLTGLARPGELVRVDGSGQLQAFALRPAGASALGRDADLRIEFRSGATLRQAPGGWMLDFTSAQAAFGSRSPIRFAQPLIKNGADTASLPLGAGMLDVTALCVAFHIDPVAGIEVILHDRWPARWLAGTVEDHGIRHPQFALPAFGVPLPDVSFARTGDTLDLFQASSVSMLFQQPFSLPGLPGAPQVLIREGRPLMVTFDSAGEPRLDGSVQLLLESRMRLDAHLEYEGTTLRFVMTGAQAAAASLEALGTALPSDPSTSVPPTADASALSSAAATLALQREAWALISGASAGRAQAGTDDSATPALPRPLPVDLNPVAAALAAWGIAAVVPGGQSLLAPPLESLLEETRLQGASLRMDDLLPLQLALLRLEHGRVSGRVPASTAAALTATQAVIDAAFERCLQDSAGISLARIEEIGTRWNELRLEAASLNATPRVEGMTGQLRPWFESMTGMAAAGTGVLAGIYDPVLNSAINTTGTPMAAGMARRLQSLLILSADLGLAQTPAGTLRDEWAVQVGARLTTLARAALNEAEARHDTAAFRQALLDLTRCAALRVYPLLSGLPQSVTLLPSTAELTAAWQRWQAVTSADHQGLSLSHSPAWHAGELRAIHELLSLTPPGVTTVPSLVQRALDAATRMLAARTTVQALAASRDADALALLVECGTLSLAVAQQAGLSPPTDWDGGMLPAIMQRLHYVATSSSALLPLHDAALFLEESARSRVQSGTGLSEARLALIEAARSISGLRMLTLQSVQAVQTEAYHAGGPTPGTLVLPGDITVSQLGGSLAFDHESQTLEGTFTGQVAVPNFGGLLTIQHGSITSDGDFEITAHGTLTLPPNASGGFSATLTIPSTSPVKIAYRVDGELEFEGGALLSLSNGMSVYVAASFLDPVYQFSFEARGLALRMLGGLVDYLPAFTLPPVITSQADYLDLWASLLESLGGTVETMTPDEPASPPPPAGLAAPPPAVAIPPEESKAVLASADVAALGATDPEPLPPDAWKNMAEVLLSTLSGGLQELQSAMGSVAGGAGSPPPPLGEAPTAASPPPPVEPVHLQFDLGSGAHVYSGPGPGQADAKFPVMNQWLPLTTNASVPFGTNPTPIEVYFGQKWGSSGYNYGSMPLVPFDTGTDLPPFFNNDLMRDGLEILPLAVQTVPMTFVMRLQQLPPSVYVVCATAMRRARPGSGNSTEADDVITFGVRLADGKVRLGHPIYLDDVEVDAGRWIRNQNYGFGVVPVKPGEALLVHSSPGYSWPAPEVARGALNSVQLLQIPLEIIDYHATPATTASAKVEPGTAVKLFYTVYGAEAVRIEPGAASGLIPPIGTLTVRPRQTTTYKLTATFDNTEQTSFLTVHVDTVADRVAKVAQEVTEKLDHVVKAMQELEKKQLAGQAANVDWTKHAAKFVEMRQLIQMALLDPKISKDPKALRQIARLGGKVWVTEQMLGTDPSGIADVFAETIVRGAAASQRDYLNAEGQVDPAKITAMSTEKLNRKATEITQFYADAAQTGTPNVGNAAASLALFTEVRKRALASLHFAEPPGAFDLGQVMDKVLREQTKLLAVTDLNAAIGGLVAWQPLPDTSYAVLNAEIIQRGLAHAGKAGPWKTRADGLDFAMAVQSGAAQLVAAAPELQAQATLLANALNSLGGVPDRAQVNAMSLVAQIASIDVPAATSSGLVDKIAAWVAKAQPAAEAALTGSWTAAKLTLGETILTLQLQVSEWMTRFPAVATAASPTPKVLVSRLTLRLKDIQADARTAKRFAGMIKKLTEGANNLLNPPPPPAIAAAGSGGDAPPPPPPEDALNATDLLAAATALAQHGASGIQSMLAWIGGLPSIPGGLQIPGDVRLERIGGSVTYDRSTGFLEGAFLGRLEIPSSGFFAEVTHASINTDGTYSLSLAGGATLPVADGNNLRLELGALQAQGTAGGQFALSGNGSMIFMNGPGGAEGTEFNVSFAYDSQLRRLQAAGAAGQVTLPFTPDLALLHGSVGLDISASGPAAMEISGSLGLIARGTPAAAPTEDDFQLVAEIAPTRLEFNGNVLTTTLTGGTLKLPPGLFGDGSERVSAAITSPIAITANRITGEVSVDFNELTVELTLPGGTVVEAGVSYNSTTRVLRLEGVSENLNLTVGDHLAVLGANFALELGGVGPQALPSGGMVQFGGTFGLLRHDKPPHTAGTPHVSDYHLALENGLVRLAFVPGTFTATLAQGTLLLPEMFSSDTGRARVSVAPMSPPRMIFAFAPPTPGMPPALSTFTLEGAVDFADLGLAIPDFEGAGAREFAGSLDFGSLQLSATGAMPAASAPKLTITNGFIFFPHPVEPTSIEIQAVNARWKLDGFPVGTLGLASDVELLDADVFTLTMLGAPGAQTTGIEILPPQGGATLPSLRIFGQLKALVDNTLITRDTTNQALAGIPVGQFGSIVGGELTLHAPVGNALPEVEFVLGDVVLTGTFRIGGPNGVHVTGPSSGGPASIGLSGMGNLFNLADLPGRQFIVTLNGKIVQDGLPGFGMKNTRFVFFALDQPPRFEPDELEYDGTSWDLAGDLPIRLDQAILKLNGSLPLDQMLLPQNVQITSTFRIGFPSVADPVVGGGADNVRVTFLPDGTPQVQNLEGIELTLNPGIKIPPIEELGGTLYLTGFNNPENLLMAGRLSGSVNGYKLKFIAAMRATGPLGLAVDVNAGSLGIPLGPTGFLFTGAGGGISFLNTSADPMDLRSYVQEVAGKFQAHPTTPPPAATMDWTGFKNWRDKLLSQIPTFPPIGTGPPLEVIAPGTYPANDPIGCPVNIPPASANIFGMPHPDQTMFPGSYILKFSSIPESKLNDEIVQGGMGITQQSIQNAVETGGALAVALAHQIRQQIDAETPEVPAQLGSGAQNAFAAFLNEIETGFATLFAQAIAALPPNATAAQIYTAIRDKAYAGIPVQDATMSVKGVFTHAAISSFMNIEGGGTIGTTGSAGVTGRVNFLGLPVGEGKMFLSATDVNGNPNPQLTGDISMALGPLQFGSTKAVLKAEGAITGLAAVVGQIANTLGTALLNEIMANVSPELAGMTLAQAEAAVVDGVPVAEQANRLATFHVAFLAQVLRRPPDTLSDTLLGEVASLLDQVNPELVICAEGNIKFAGFKVSNGLANFRFRMRKTGREAYFDIAPLGFIGYGTPLAMLTSGLDRASMAYAETFPDVTGLLKRLLNGKINSPASIQAEARYQVASMLENGTMTGTYDLNPLGMSLFRANARLINPDLTAHPVVRNNNASPTDNWVRPGTGVNNKIPTREELLLEAVRKEALGDVFWKGKGDNLNSLFEGKYEELQGKTLTHDYFPHGGLAVAAMLNVPRIFSTLPREQWATLTNPNADALARLNALRAIMRDYFGSTVQQGSLMAYVPLPNPPALFNNGAPIEPPPSLDPLDLVNSLKTVNPDTLSAGPLWELGESFAYLHLEGDILDIPVGVVDLAAVGPNSATNAPAMFSGEVHFADGSWAQQLFGGVNVTAKVTGQARPARRTMAAAFAELEALDIYGPSPNETQLKTAMDGLAAAAADVVAQDLPRVELSASVTNFIPPGTWGWTNEVAANGALTLSAYSPEFLPVLPANPTDLQRLQKTGGIAVEGNFQLGNLVGINGQLLLEPPTQARPRPRAIATLTGQTLSLPAPFGTVANATVNVDTESATFVSIQGTLQSQVTLTAQGWPVTIPANATVAITNHSATFTFDTGGVSATVTANYSNPLAPTFDFSGQLEFDPLVTNAISIRPKAGTGSKLLVTVNGSSGSLTNARVQIDGAFAKSANLPALSVGPSLNFASTSISAALGSLSLQGFPTNGLNWKVQRVGGVLAVTDVSGSVTTAALGAGFTTSISGSVASDGSFSFTGTTSAGATLVGTGLPVSSLATSASLAFSGSSIQVTGTVSGGLLGTSLLPGGTSTMAGVQLTLSSAAVTGISGTVNVSAMRLGALELRPNSGDFTLTLGMNGITVPGANLYFTPFSTGVQIASISGFTVPPLSATLPATLLNQSTGITGNVAGYGISGFTFQLQRTSGSPLTYRLNNVAFSASLPSGFSSGTFNVTGGSFDGQSSTASLPLVSLPSLTAGRFSITNNGTGVSLTSTGLRLPAPRFSCSELGISNVTIPVVGGALVLPDNGNFSVTGFSVPSISPALGSLTGFPLTGVTFDLSKTLVQGVRMTNFNASLAVPGFTASGLEVSVASITSSIGSSIHLTGSSLAQMSVGQFIIKGPSGGGLTSSLSSSTGLRFVAGQMDVVGLFTAPANFTSVNLTVPPSTTDDASFLDCSMAPSLRGYALGTSSFSLSRVGGAVQLYVTASLPLPSGPTVGNLTGTISSNGVVDLDGSLTGADFFGFPVSADFDLSALDFPWTAYIDDSDPRALWRMEESGSTNILSNSSDYAPAHNGLTTDASTRPALQQPSGFRDGSGVSMLFDGTNDFYSVPDNANLEGGNAMSVGCWFKVNQFTAGKSFHTLVAKGDDSWRLAQDGSNNYLSFDTNSASSQHALRASTVPVNDGKWHFVVATYDGSMKRLYIDGVLRAAEAWSGTIRDSTYDVGIGHNPQVGGRNWNGWLDEVAFWNVALDPARIHTLYNSGNGLSLEFSGTANLRDSSPVFRPSFFGSVNTNGEFSLSASNQSASLLGFSFNQISLRFQRSVLPTVTTTISGGASLTGLPVNPFGSYPRFSATFTRNGGNTTASLSANDLNVTLGGYSSAVGGFDLAFTGTLGTPTPISFSDFRFGNATLANLGLPPLSGFLQSNGTFAIASPFTDSITLSGFTAPTCAVDFGDYGLYVQGSFNLNVTSGGHTRSFGAVTLTGTLGTNGAYSLAGNGSIQIGGYSTDSIGLTFSSSTGRLTASGVPNLNFGGLDMAVSSFFLAANGFNGTMTKGFGPITTSHLANHLDTTFSGTTTLSYDFTNGSLSGNVSGTWGWQVKNFAPPGGYNPSGSFSISAGIGDNGDITVNNDNASGGSFFAPFWSNGPDFAPPPGWGWGFWDNEPYSLW